MILSPVINKKNVAYWIIFIAYSFLMTFFIVSFAHSVEQDIALTSISISV